MHIIAYVPSVSLGMRDKFLNMFDINIQKVQVSLMCCFLVKISNFCIDLLQRSMLTCPFSIINNYKSLCGPIVSVGFDL
jgi:hypothetical protein